MVNNTKFNDSKYNLWGRHYPAVVSLTFPLLAIIIFFFNEIQNDGLSDFENIFKIILFFGTIIPSLFFFYMMTMREISIEIIENFLDWAFGKPTSNLFLPSCNMITNDMKTSVKKKLKEGPKIDLDDSVLLGDKKESRRNRPYRHRVNEAFSYMRESVWGDSILLEFNAVYGFFRNLAGGMLINIFIVIGLSFAEFKDTPEYADYVQWAIYALCGLFVICIIFLLTSRYRYAKRIFYLYSQKEE